MSDSAMETSPNRGRSKDIAGHAWLVGFGDESATEVERQLRSLGFVTKRVAAIGTLNSSSDRDVVLLMLGESSVSPRETIQAARGRCPNAILLACAPTVDEDLIVDSISAGANDFFSLSRAGRLHDVIAKQTGRLQPAKDESNSAVFNISLDDRALCIVDELGVVIDFNAPFGTLLGVNHRYPPLPVSEAIPGLRESTLRASIRQALKGHKPLLRFEMPGEGPRWMEARLTPMPASAKLPTTAVAYVADSGASVSQRRRNAQRRVLCEIVDVTDKVIDEIDHESRDQKLKVLMDQLPAILWTTDTDLVFTSSLGSGLSGLGLEPDSVVGMSLFEYFGTKDRRYKPIESHIRALKGISTIYDFEWQDRTFSTRVEPLRDTSQTIVGTVGLAYDITDSIQAASALAESEYRYRSVISSMSEGVIVVDRGGKIIDWNPSAERILEIEPSILANRTAIDALSLISPEGAPVDTIDYPGVRSLSSGKPVEGQVFCRTRMNGSLSWLMISADPMTREGDTEPFAAVVSIADITQLRETDVALKSTESRFASVVQSAMDGIVVIDDNHLVTVFNSAAEQIFGLNTDEVLGRPITMLMPERYRRGHSDRLRKFTSGSMEELGRRAPLQVLGLRANGEEFPMEVSASHVRIEGKSYYMAILRDVSERQRRDRELEAIAEISVALRDSKNPAEMNQILLEQTHKLLQADASVIAMRDQSTGETNFELGFGEWESVAGQRYPKGIGITGQVIETGEPYINNDSTSEKNFLRPDIMQRVSCIATVPLVAQGKVIGALWIGRNKPIGENDLHVLQAIAGMSANALNRSQLHERAETQLKWLIALRDIDVAIGSSLDLRVTMNVLLEQLIAQLHVDAADILLVNKDNRLEFAAGCGFADKKVEDVSLAVGESYAGRAAETRQTLHIANLADESPEFYEALKAAGEEFASYYAIPLIAKGQVKGILEVFQRDNKKPHPEWLDFLETLLWQAAIAIDNAELFDDLQRTNQGLAVAYDETIEGWSRALDLRDKETEGHTRRVTELTIRLARRFGIPKSELVHIRRGALLHDIGKMGVPDSILLKPGALTIEEWEVMKMHPVYALEMLSPIGYLQPALDIPYCHHERWDGTGYPRGLAGEEIPLSARIFAVVDVWDALTSERPYRGPWPESKVRQYLADNSGKQFDPKIVEAFLEMIDRLESVA